MSEYFNNYGSIYDHFPSGHPVKNYIDENKIIINLSNELSNIVVNETTFVIFKELFFRLANVDIHYTRKENQLFPYLEKYGFNGPSQGMWAFHDELRDNIRSIKKAIEKNDYSFINSIMYRLCQGIEHLVQKEEEILLPRAISLLSEEDWIEMREGEEEIGYLPEFSPQSYPQKSDEYIHPSKLKAPKTLPFSTEGMNHFDEGYLSPEQVNFIFKFLPVDITYVDENDRVLFYNRGEERVFPRSKGIIGREIQFCHPPKSLDAVLEIVREFKNGNRDVADFWIQFKGKFIHIRYFAVRDENKKYRGVIEMSQDVTEIRSLEGEKRLLNWE